ncbi:hypothetical protein D3C87_1311610 [compost metagenome]
MKEARNAAMPCSAMLSVVQPSERCTERTGRDWLMRKISFRRMAKTCPDTSADASDAR